MIERIYLDSIGRRSGCDWCEHIRRDRRGRRFLIRYSGIGWFCCISCKRAYKSNERIIRRIDAAIAAGV